MANTHTFVSDEEFAALIGEGIEGGFRSSNAPNSRPLWHFIFTHGGSDEAWQGALEYCVEGLKSMGYRLVKETS